MDPYEEYTLHWNATDLCYYVAPAAFINGGATIAQWTYFTCDVNHKK